ncbi:hypothetical protein [[Clostridium] fimetarium]|uniref:Uncharacterized protein n=1 Tax=[Clostridium] fimetarium TaxID=99656 RepID=A0A1I0P821_9FIRM|nr:hypothetical protein [[Clostridium] fimetarium]SEW10270.1 hypothetical protein SAMN05421659_104226 [[Clostridium] fimetarium]
MRDFKEQTENIIERINKYKIHKSRQKKVVYSVTSFAAVVIIVGYIAITQMPQQDPSYFVEGKSIVSSASAEGEIANNGAMQDKNTLKNSDASVENVDGGAGYNDTLNDQRIGAVESVAYANNSNLPTRIIKSNENIIASNVFEQNLSLITNKISGIVTKYDYEPYNNMLEVVKSMLDIFNIKPSNLNNLTIGTPFIIYELDRDDQDGIFHYPVFDNDKVILNVSIMVVTSGLSISIDQDMVPQLNSINYASGSCIFYESNGSIVAESSNQNIYLAGNENKLCREFANLSFAQRIEKISTRIDSFILTE